jgi:hypothetical protein
MNGHPSELDAGPPAAQSWRSIRRGILRAALMYLVSVYVVWLCYYLIGDIRERDLRPGVVVAAFFTTFIAMILFGIPTMVGSAILLLIRPKPRPLWLILLAVLVALSPGIYWSSRPSVDHTTVLTQQIAQTLFLGYLLFRLLRPRGRG